MEWRDVVGYEGIYEVSATGLVRRCKGRYCTENRLVKAHWAGKGERRRLQVQLSRPGDSRTQPYLHRVVAEAFCGKRPTGAIVRFKDGNPANVVASNLEWARGRRRSPKVGQKVRENRAEIWKLNDMGFSKASIRRQLQLSRRVVDRVLAEPRPKKKVVIRKNSQ